MTTTANAHALESYMEDLSPLLDDPEVTEVCINAPGGAHVERYRGWTYEPLAACTLDWCRSFAAAVANFTSQGLNPQEPILSATLPAGERVQIVIPPVAPKGCVSLTIRKPSTTLWTLDDLAAEHHVFRHTKLAVAAPDDALGRLLARGDFVGFARQAVQARSNILLSGATGSGKTTVAKALILEIAPEDRIVAIEDARELVLRNQPNSVSLLYSQGGQGQSLVSGAELIVSALRMRPDWIMPSEIRTAPEALALVGAISSGHSSITSTHAKNAADALLGVAMKFLRSDGGRGMSFVQAIDIVQRCVDVVIQCERVGQRRFVSEVWYDPSTKQRGLA